MITTERGRTWKCWTEDDARRALGDWNRAEESLAQLAERLGVSPTRVARWAGRLGYIEEGAGNAGRRRTGVRSHKVSAPNEHSAGANGRPGFVAITVGGDMDSADVHAADHVAILVNGIRIELGAGASAARIVEVAALLAQTVTC